ncbi:MAG TPA: hypothetical protein VJ696_09520 [Rhodanobacteraceae bacterium]|nr:hypothetical protein [Rhodanobacteraceae bacterium]
MKALALPLALFGTLVFAQAKTDYTLNGGQVNFHVPPDWIAIMEKSDGDPQAVIFQVPDETAQGTEDTASVTVKTRTLKAGGDFQGFVTDSFERAKGQTGYETDASNKDSSVHRYFVTHNKTRYLVRDTYQLNGTVGIEVRCQRPLLDATPKEWADHFDAACGSVVASLKH